MSLSRNEASLVWGLAGPPGVGKTTLTQIIASEAESRGKKIHVIPEFPKFLEWVDKNKKKKQYITWVEGDDDRHFELSDQAYKLAFDYVAQRLVQEFNQYKDKSDIQIFEAARRIKGVRYGHLYAHMTRALGPKVKFVNMEVQVSPHRELERRVLNRSVGDKLAAPLPILKLYLADEHNYPTAVSDAAQFGDSFIWNGTFDNSRTQSESEISVRGIVGQVIAMHNWS